MVATTLALERLALRSTTAMTPSNRPTIDVYMIDPDTIAVVGEIDLATAPILRRALVDTSVRRIELSGVTFMDAAGLAALLDAHRPGQREHDLTLVAPSRSVRRLLDLIGHRHTFPTAS